jgi:hypothetical protein
MSITASGVTRFLKSHGTFPTSCHMGLNGAVVVLGLYGTEAEVALRLLQQGRYVVRLTNGSLRVYGRK